MAKRAATSRPGWSDVKAGLSGLDRPRLVALIKDLYDDQKDNRTSPN